MRLLQTFCHKFVFLCLSPQEVAAVDGLYRIRVPRVSLQADRQQERQMEGYLTAFVRAVCISFKPALPAQNCLPCLQNAAHTKLDPLRSSVCHG